ncbi:hypothetical protein HI914_04837 [Erysiphe necator]|nr:hypothetical protein HI914_04837 [Erysiphe necator]
MASRQERIQQRLRGALRREIRDVDFGLTVPATLRGAPQPLAVQLNPIRTSETPLTQQNPKEDSVIISNLTPRNQASLKHRADVPEGSGGHSNTTRSANANTSKKRRTLVEDDKLLISSQSPRKSARKNNIQNHQFLLDDSESNIVPVSALHDVSSDPIDSNSNRKKNSRADISNLKFERLGRTPSRSQAIQLVTESPTDAPGSGQRIRLIEPISQESIFSSENSIRKRSIDNNSSLTYEGKIEQSKSIAQNLSKLQDKKFINLQALNDVSDDNELDELSPDRSFLQDLRASVRSSRFQSSSVEQEKESVANTIEDESVAKILSTYQKQREENSRHESTDLDLPSIEPTKKKKRQSRPRSYLNSTLENRKTISNFRAKNNKKNHKKRPNDSIPFTVHKLMMPTNLIDEQDDHNNDEILEMRKPHLTRRDINWIDVLINVCEEFIGSRIVALKEKLDECNDMTTRKGFKTMYQAVKVFGKELQDHLLEYTLDLDNAHCLERRLREEQKKKLHLREEIMRIRKEREQVARQLDEIRQKHSQAEKETMYLENLNNAIHNLELTMDIAREENFSNCSTKTSTKNHHHNESYTLDFSSTQVLLKSIMHQVTSQRSSSIGGLLMQVKDFNSFLERSAGVLEQRSGA